MERDWDKERDIIDAAFAEKRERMDKLFRDIAAQCEGTCMFTWHATPDGGYSSPDPDAEYTIDAWMFWFYEATAELVGGAQDGAEVYEGYNALLGPLLKLFTECREAHASCEVWLEDGPYVVLSGDMDGFDVPISIYICLRPPTYVKPHIRCDENGARWVVDCEDEDDEDEDFA